MLINSKIKPPKLDEMTEVKIKLPEVAWAGLKRLGRGNIGASVKDLCKHLSSCSGLRTIKKEAARAKSAAYLTASFFELRLGDLCQRPFSGKKLLQKDTLFNRM